MTVGPQEPLDSRAWYSLAAHYDAQTRSFAEDLLFYRKALGGAPGDVLELGCGTGRIAEALALEGHRVTGIDNAPEMLERALRRSRASNWSNSRNPRYMEGDFRSLQLPGRFDAVICGLNTMCHVHEYPELRETLLGVRKHLRPGGRFLIDVFNPRLEHLLRRPARQGGKQTYSAPEGGGWVTVRESSRYDPASQLLHVTWHYRLPRRKVLRGKLVRTVAIRVFFPRELDNLLLAHGYTVETKYGDYGLTPFSAESPKQLISARPATAVSPEARLGGTGRSSR